MFFVVKICKRALRASTEGNLAVAASTPTYSSLINTKIRPLSSDVKDHYLSALCILDKISNVDYVGVGTVGVLTFIS